MVDGTFVDEALCSSCRAEASVGYPAGVNLAETERLFLRAPEEGKIDPSG
jgi:hypothetical protein